MKKIINWQILLALVLVALSLVFYFLHYLLFRDLHHIFLYLVGDVAFLFVDVLIVMLVLHRLLEHREKQARLKKMNMVIGAFFVEMGTELMARLMRLEAGPETLKTNLVVSQQWQAQDFTRARTLVQNTEFASLKETEDLYELKEYLQSQRPFLLSLLENSNLLEHESFTDLLWAIFHLTDELAHRPQVKHLARPDASHLAGDAKRAYQQLIIQWLDYMKHLKQDYPYLFSLAARTNPFDVNAAVEVKA